MDVLEMPGEDDEPVVERAAEAASGPALLYQENALFHRYDVEWRYRVMSRFFLMLAALLLVSRWLWEIQKYEFLWLPFFFISVLSLCFFLLDRRVVSQITVSARVAARLEKLIHPRGGHFVGLSKAGRHIPGRRHGSITIVSYSFVLGFIYMSTALVSAAVTIYALWRF
jgi:hypothetical protein